MKGFQIQQKGERRISAALRIMLVVVLLAVQIGFVVAISYFMQEYLALAYAVVQVAALFLAIHIYNEPGELSYKLIWFILLLLAPPVGMILWFLWGGAAQKRLHARDHLHHAERLCQIVVRAEVEPGYLVVFGVLCRRHNNGNVAELRRRFHPAQKIDAADAGQHNIDNRKLRLLAAV